ncbi:hypothetical protein [Paenibacillus mendelii]|uniref:Pentapeptide MXKDX repeat protein n=1 Tax=Paenibacillus mendelii TaxID=206163 RepID=A0ABV6J765_9BACL|nr:hypothetical protein [Paenibacillus mendelii]MCQ6562071.1 hypothetical protein [Paenibacillus mendelii]
MKKIAIVIMSACMLLTAGSAAYASAPVSEKKHEHKMHTKKMLEKKKKNMRSKSTHKVHKMHTE